VPIELPPLASIKVRLLSPGEAELMEETAGLRDQLTDPDQAVYLAGLRRKAARYPKDPFALQLLADAEYAAEQYPASRAAVDALLALQPENGAAKVRKAMLLLHEAEDLQGKPLKDSISEARRLIVSANRAAPEDAPPLVAFYRSYLISGDRPTPSAVEGLMQAVSTVPQDEGARMMLVSELARQGRLPEAIAYLQPLAFDPHASPGQRQAMVRLGELREALARKAAPAPAKPAS
jgi:tetratricopeptide (TPR) repeat protein